MILEILNVIVQCLPYTTGLRFSKHLESNICPKNRSLLEWKLMLISFDVKQTTSYLKFRV